MMHSFGCHSSWPIRLVRPVVSLEGMEFSTLCCNNVLCNHVISYPIKYISLILMDIGIFSLND